MVPGTKTCASSLRWYRDVFGAQKWNSKKLGTSAYKLIDGQKSSGRADGLSSTRTCGNHPYLVITCGQVYGNVIVHEGISTGL